MRSSQCLMVATIDARSQCGCPKAAAHLDARGFLLRRFRVHHDLQCPSHDRDTAKPSAATRTLSGRAHRCGRRARARVEEEGGGGGLGLGAGVDAHADDPLRVPHKRSTQQQLVAIEREHLSEQRSQTHSARTHSYAMLCDSSRLANGTAVCGRPQLGCAARIGRSTTRAGASARSQRSLKRRDATVAQPHLLLATMRN